MEKNIVWDQILSAAEARFQFYGYQKTTMAEIAGDCDMSAANLYRYFDNKLEIGSALAKRCLTAKEALLELVINDDQLSIEEKLPVFVITAMRHTYHEFEATPKLSELVDAMTTQRPNIIAEHNDSKRTLLLKLLAMGQQQGVFVFDDIETTADTLLSATFLFYCPLTITKYSLSELEDKARQVCALLLRGLKPA